MISFTALVIVLVTFENGLVLWALKRFVTLRKPANILLGGLAVADFCMVIPLILKIIQISTRVPVICLLQGITEHITVSCTSLHLACLAVERYISIKYCLRYEYIVTKRRIYACIAVLWTFSIVVSFIVPVSVDSGTFGRLADSLVTLCSPSKKYGRMSDLPQHVFYYAKFMLISFFVVPCVVILLSNMYILIASSRQRKKIMLAQSSDVSKLRAAAKRLFGDLKAARMLFIIQLLFVVTYFPYFAVTVYRLEKRKHNDRVYFRVSKSLSFLTSLTSCLNPIIYVSSNKQFRQAFRKLLGIRKNGNRSPPTTTST